MLTALSWKVNGDFMHKALNVFVLSINNFLLVVLSSETISIITNDGRNIVVSFMFGICRAVNSHLGFVLLKTLIMSCREFSKGSTKLPT